MNNPEPLKQFSSVGVLPVIGLSDPEKAVRLATIFMEEGLPVLEVTLRSVGALESIRQIRKTFPEMTLAAGTVLAASQADEALSAGADCIVSPGFDPELASFCREREISYLPGCVTAAEISAGRKFGLKIFKFFPAELNGGVAALKLLHGPFADCGFVPTGGITFENLPEYLACSFVAACGGSFMAKSTDIAAGNWDSIRNNCRRCVDLSLGLELGHVGINHPDETTALDAANRLAELFRFPVKNGNSSVFWGKAVENMKHPYFGTNGHIGFTTCSAERALAYCRRRNIPLREESIRRETDGRVKSFYLAEEIGGFALHLVQR